MPKIEEIEAKIYKVAETITALKRDNLQLKTERDSLQSHVAMLTSENNKAQRILADYAQIRKKHEQVTHRVERALSTLNALRPS